jgi:hypothetical protein
MLEVNMFVVVTAFDTYTFPLAKIFVVVTAFETTKFANG